jgi:peptidoglycan/LPS O-acetylase OafA/YrhL
MDSPGRPRRHWRGLDGLRAIAVTAVVVYHFSPLALPGGFLGVDIFFVISGYLITRLLAEEFLRKRRIDVGRFYLRRARRLLPALMLVLAVVCVAALFWPDQLATLRGGVIAAAGFSGNWWLAFDHQSYFVATGRPSMLQHLWSLGVEEQFYLVWPLAVAATLAAGRRAARRSGRSSHYVVARLSALAVGLALASTALTWWLADVHDVPYGNDGSLLYYGTDTHCMGLLLGASYGAWVAATGGTQPRDDPAAQRRSAIVTRCLDGCGALALFLLLLFGLRLAAYSHSLYRGDFLYVSALVVVVIAAATRADSVLGNALEWAPLRWIGVRSYSIYLWHWPVAVVTRPGLDTTMPLWLDQLFRVALTVALSDLTYRYVETPFRRAGFRATIQAAIVRVRADWRTRRHAGVALPAAMTALILTGVAVILIGPAAPKPSAALGAGPGGRHLSLTASHPGTPTSEGTTARPPRPRDAGGLPKLSGFGDSVLLGARGALGAIFPGGSIDAVEGRQPDPILADIRTEADKHALDPLVVIHIGDNGLINPDDLRHTLAGLGQARLVLVLTDHLDPYDAPWQRPNNATIHRVVPGFRNAAIVDWNAVAAAHRDWLYPDDIHLRPVGARGYAHLIASDYRHDLARITPPTPPGPDTTIPPTGS